MRFSLKASFDSDADSFVDTDGQITNGSPREEPGHIDMLDNKWHMATLVQVENGYRVYLDGRLSGIVEGVGAGPINPAGDILLCSRGDFSSPRHFSGAVSNLLFYGESLTDKQVYQLYHNMSICDNKDEVRKTASYRTCCIPLTEPEVPGDVNSDGLVNILDVVQVVNFIVSVDYISPCGEYNADYNQSGAIDITVGSTLRYCFVLLVRVSYLHTTLLAGYCWPCKLYRRICSRRRFYARTYART